MSYASMLKMIIDGAAPKDEKEAAETIESTLSSLVEKFYSGTAYSGADLSGKKAKASDPKELFDAIVPKELRVEGMFHVIDVEKEAVKWEKTTYDAETGARTGGTTKNNKSNNNEYLVFNYGDGAGKNFVAGSVFSDLIIGSKKDDMFFSSAGVSGGIDVIQTGDGRDVLPMCPFMNKRVVTDFDLNKDVLGITDMFGRDAEITITDTVVNGKKSVAITFNKGANAGNLRDWLQPKNFSESYTWNDGRSVKGGAADDRLLRQNAILDAYDEKSTEIKQDADGNVTSLDKTGGFILEGITAEEFMKAVNTRKDDMIQSFGYAEGSFAINGNGTDGLAMGTSADASTTQPKKDKGGDTLLGVSAANTPVRIFENKGGKLAQVYGPKPEPKADPSLSAAVPMDVSQQQVSMQQNSLSGAMVSFATPAAGSGTMTVGGFDPSQPQQILTTQAA